MPQVEFHKSEYSEGSKLKLELFEQYLRSWLPVFIYRHDITTIRIYDFFCGPGSDLAGSLGSPLRVLKIVKEFSEMLRKEKKRVFAFFSDKELPKIKELDSAIQQDTNYTEFFHSEIEHLTFEDAFPRCLKQMKKPRTANFIFIDPCGLAVNPKHFKELINLKNSDFLLFIPASYVRRFVHHDRSFIKYFPGLRYDGHVSLANIHKVICKYYQENFIPTELNYHLAPFSIQKKNTINGLIFGSAHIRGLSKFINACWRLDTENGEAGIGLKADLPKIDKQFPLPGINSSSKIRQFEIGLEQAILDKKLRTNKDVHDYSLKMGCWPPRHAQPVMRRMKKEGKIASTLPLGYDSIYKNKNVQKIELIK